MWVERERLVRAAGNTVVIGHQFWNPIPVTSVKMRMQRGGGCGGERKINKSKRK